MYFTGMNQLVVGLALLMMPSLSSLGMCEEEEVESEEGTEVVILLHGLCRSSRSMRRIEERLLDKGYDVLNLDYASTRKPMDAIIKEDVDRAVCWCWDQGYDRIHFVTHSLGGIVLRTYLQKNALPPGSRVVMLAPPNQGSELADTAMAWLPRAYKLGGPNAFEIGTGADALVANLAPVDEEIGVIAGSRSWNPIFSSILPGADDGKVAVTRTPIPEMTDFLIVPDTHWTVLYDAKVHKQIIHFLETGGFHHDCHKKKNGACNQGRMASRGMAANRHGRES